MTSGTDKTNPNLRQQAALAAAVAEKSKWQLTQAAFDALLLALDKDLATAGEKYLFLRRNLARFFENRGFHQAEEASDEVLNRLARKLETGSHFENVNTYALGVARMLALELRKSPEQKISNALPEVSVSPFESHREKREIELNCLEECLCDLPGETREFIVGYYQGEKSEKIANRQNLAQKFGIPQNALRNRAVRLRDKLETCIIRCVKKKDVL